MAYPEDHDENDLPPLPPAPEPTPLPAPDDGIADQQALLDELAEQFSAQDETAATPTTEVQGLKDLDLPAPDLLFPQPKRPTEKQRVEEKNRAHAEFLKQAESFTAAPPPVAPAPPLATEKPSNIPPLLEPIPGGTPGQLAAQAALLKSLEEMFSPADAIKEGQTEFSREFQGEPGRDFGKQEFPQGDHQNDAARAEADLRSAQEQYHRAQLELTTSLVAMFNDLAGEVARLRDYLNRRRH